MTDVIGNVLFCDEIREEINGKVFLIGAYQGDLFASIIPGTITLATYITVRSPLSEGNHSFHISAVFDSESSSTEVASSTFEVTINEPELPAILKANGMQFWAETPGTLKILLSINDSPANQIDQLRVRLATSIVDTN